MAEGPNGEPCTTTAYQEVPIGADSGPDRVLRDVFLVHYSYPHCPTEAGVPPVETPSSFAAHYWQDVPLPEPSPQIQPGRAITGKFAYLETRGSTSHTFAENDTPFGPLEIEATGKYYVDWGDGTTTGPHPDEGAPWPDGRITHEYLRVGKYDVVVTERWTATWHFGAESGTLNELRTTGRIDDFPVEQIQAVRYR